MTASRDMTADELLGELDIVRGYPRMAVERAVAAERARIIAAGDALAEAAQTVADGTPPEIRLTFGPYARLRAALDAWKAATG